MGKLYKIKESDIVKSLNEAIEEKNTNSRINTFSPSFSEKIDGSLFKNGIDVIDTKNPKFIEVVTKLKTLSKNNNVTIIGGASAVGTANGYDNVSLAKRRAVNFINALRNFGVDVSRYNISTQVGKSTVKDSVEANNEQFVKIVSNVNGKMEGAIDNTAVKKPNENIGAIQRTKTIKVPAQYFDNIIALLKSKGYNIK